eukprot:jgi/Botrbrau1/16480/Bobra.0142s0074.1
MGSCAPAVPSSLTLVGSSGSAHDTGDADPVPTARAPRRVRRLRRGRLPHPGDPIGALRRPSRRGPSRSLSASPPARPAGQVPAGLAPEAACDDMLGVAVKARANAGMCRGATCVPHAEACGESDLRGGLRLSGIGERILAEAFDRTPVPDGHVAGPAPNQAGKDGPVGKGTDKERNKTMDHQGTPACRSGGRAAASPALKEVAGSIPLWSADGTSAGISKGPDGGAQPRIAVRGWEGPLHKHVGSAAAGKTHDSAACELAGKLTALREKGGIKESLRGQVPSRGMTVESGWGTAGLERGSPGGSGEADDRPLGAEWLDRFFKEAGPESLSMSPGTEGVPTPHEMSGDQTTDLGDPNHSPTNSPNFRASVDNKGGVSSRNNLRAGGAFCGEPSSGPQGPGLRASRRAREVESPAGDPGVGQSFSEEDATDTSSASWMDLRSGVEVEVEVEVEHMCETSNLTPGPDLVDAHQSRFVAKGPHGTALEGCARPEALAHDEVHSGSPSPARVPLSGPHETHVIGHWQRLEEIAEFAASWVCQVSQKEAPKQEELAALSLEVVCLEWALDDLQGRLRRGQSQALHVEEAPPEGGPAIAEERSLAEIDAALRARGIQLPPTLPLSGTFA